MEGGEFAKAYGKFDAYHQAVFKAYFTDCKDIGDRAVILDIAKAVGLDTMALDAALEGGIYLPRLQSTTKKAKANGISAAPTFVIEGYGPISGAQPIDTFRKILHGMKENINEKRIYRQRT